MCIFVLRFNLATLFKIWHVNVYLFFIWHPFKMWHVNVYLCFYVFFLYIHSLKMWLFNSLFQYRTCPSFDTVACKRVPPAVFTFSSICTPLKKKASFLQIMIISWKISWIIYIAKCHHYSMNKILKSLLLNSLDFIFLKLFKMCKSFLLSFQNYLIC